MLLGLDLVLSRKFRQYSVIQLYVPGDFVSSGLNSPPHYFQELGVHLLPDHDDRLLNRSVVQVYDVALREEGEYFSIAGHDSHERIDPHDSRGGSSGQY